MANVHEERARERKIQALIQAIDAHVAFVGLHPSKDGYAVADMLGRWTAEQWAELSVSAGQRPPSEETIRQIVARIKRRADWEREDPFARTGWRDDPFRGLPGQPGQRRLA